MALRHGMKGVGFGEYHDFKQTVWCGHSQFSYVLEHCLHIGDDGMDNDRTLLAKFG